ncbi:MAG: START-like domain-containing protein [Bacteroidales bacterium]|nr:START-like domain-containing protein [Bacteroidales bacterium]
MAKKKIELEFEMNTMPGVLYKRFATPDGLATWFADAVVCDGDEIYSFLWGKDVITRAFLLGAKENKFVRFRWEDDDEDDYFEFEILESELSGVITLKVIDFSEEDEYEDVVRLWNFQIESLKRILAA